MADSITLSQFQLRLFSGSPNNEPEYETTALLSEWKKYKVIYISGFDGRITVQLDDVWATIHDTQTTHYEGDVIGLETIVKFGDTQQLKTRYTVVIDLMV